MDFLELVPRTDELTGTVGDDVLTVHSLSAGKPLCGAAGEVVQWKRAVSCPACAEAD